ncbi:MAG: hypothetical protein AMJ84_10080 [Acidithiobacillales bacterium SM23_46]|nr:MAG: hypothetical protein AMJ84_10080 [Acidithiobacillales bacterium SM23_46]
MTGRGGGNFYVLVLVLAGCPMHEAATSGQFILFTTAFAAMLIFQRHGVVEWRLVVGIGSLAAMAAFAGGYLSAYVAGRMLKFVFSALLVIAAFLMVTPVKKKPVTETSSRGQWRLRTPEGQFIVNLWISIPITLATGFGAGMVGVSGGSFLVPLMVLACSVPMPLAVGTASAMVGSTALMGFLGHLSQGHFDAAWALPFACAAIIGGILGSRFALKTKPERLKMLFAYTTLAAAIVMAINAFVSHAG